MTMNIVTESHLQGQPIGDKAHKRPVRMVRWFIIVGLLLALLVSRLIRSLFFEVDPADPVIYLGVIALLGLAALLACWLPARRAARVDPIITLRSE